MSGAGFLTDVGLLAAVATLVVAAVVVFAPHALDATERACETFLAWRRRTAIDRLARRGVRR